MSAAGWRLSLTVGAWLCWLAAAPVAVSDPYHAHGAPDPASLGGAFTLQDTDGRPVTDRDLRGSFALIYFGYTRCQEACPVALRTISRALELLGDEAQSVQPVFVNIDERDSADHVAGYARAFHPRLLALTGSRRQLHEVGALFKVRREMAPARNHERGHRLNHTTWIFLVGPDGVTRDYFYHGVAPEALAAKLEAALQHGDASGR